MFQQLSREAPTSVPVRLTPWKTAVGSGPPIVIQYSEVLWTTAPAGMPEIVIELELGPPARVARLVPPEAMPPPGRMKSEPGLKPVSRRRVDAVRTRIRGFVTPLRGSLIGLPVDWSADRTVLTDAEGETSLRSAHAPATCGVAIEVPLKTAKPPPGTDELMLEPGASSSTRGLEFENDDIVSLF